MSFHSVISSLDLYVARRLLPISLPNRYNTPFLRLLALAALISSIYVSLSCFHYQTYVWQSTTMADYFMGMGDGSTTRDSCWLSPPSTNDVKKMEWVSSNNPRLKIGMIMLYDEDKQTGGEWGASLMKDVLRNHLKYAKKHGYDPIIANQLVDKSRPSPWSKLLAIEKYLPSYDYLMYLDMDTIIMNADIRLESFVAAAGPCADIVMTEDWNGPNTGIWLIKNSQWSNWFVKHAWEVGLPLVEKRSALGAKKHPFEYEQRVFHYLLESKVWKDRELPRYPGGNGGTPVETSHRAVRSMRSHVAVLAQCALNSYCLHPLDSRGLPNAGSRYVDGDFLIHFAGKKGTIKADLMRHYLAVADSKAWQQA